MNYTVIVPAWNEAAFLASSLKGISEAMQGVESHQGILIVVDNNSTDSTADIAANSGARVVFEPINQIARARNAGAAKAQGEALIFVDADSRCSAGLLQQALDGLASGKWVGGGSVIEPDRDVDTKAQRGLDFWNWISRNRKLAAGCFLFCRRDAFEAVGGFSNKVYAGEELFLCRALKRWGRSRNLGFEILESHPIVTSVRKLDWYSPTQLFGQVALMLIPGALYSKRLCRTWYDTEGSRKRL